MVWRAEDPQGGESQKVKFDIVQFTRGAGLDLGCGPSKTFAHFVGVDSCKDTELFNIAIKPDVVVDTCEVLDKFEDAACDFVFSSHLLEHIEDTEAALKEWWRVIKVGGHLVLYLPHKALYPNVGQPGANPDHKHDFMPVDIYHHMLSATDGFDLLVDQERSEGTEYSFLQVYRKRDDGLYSASVEEDTRGDKTACVVRYGGFGDMIQASNILPELKRQGYHVTFMTTPKGQEILKHNPFIDEFFIQDDDQVLNQELTEFWKVQAKRFTKFIQLSESIEGTLLAMPGRANHAWSYAMRHKLLNVNYLEFTADLAELPYISDAIFYPSDEEDAKAKSYLAGIRNKLAGPLMIGARAEPRFNIMWVLSGSSMHKFYPWQDAVIANVLLEIPEAVVIFNGDYACQILEQGWEQEPRVRCESGNMHIRESLTLAKHVDCVVGPETGVLNAVGFEPVGKVIMLSHSSKENLTKHWVNTTTLEPQNTPCYPCHRLHYGREFCHETPETGAAICQTSITPDRAFEAIMWHYQDWKSRQLILSAA